MPITRLSPRLLRTGSNGALLITSSNALTASYALNATAGGVSSVTAGSGLSGGTITSAGTIALDTGSTHFISGSISVLNNKTVISSSGQVSYTGLSNVPVGIVSSSGQVNGANITNNTVSYTAGAGLSGGGSATLGGGAVTIDAVAGAGISLTAPTNDAININTASAHFVTGSRGTISSANTTGAAGISLTYNNATGIISGTLLNSTVSVTAGNGLTGGGAISLGNSATLDVAAGAGISVTAPTTDAVNLDTGSNHFISGARASISVVDTVGASGIDLIYNSGTGVLSASLVTSTFNVGAGSGLTGGGSANLGATSTVNVGAGLGVTVNADDIAIDTSSAHFTSGVKSKLNTDGVVSSSTQFTSLTAPFTGSFTGSFRGSYTGTGTPHFNVRAFGAIGNGTTDDYTAFSASLAAITIAGGGTLYIPKGNYRIGTGLRITSNTNIKGDGVQNTIINCNHLTTLPGGAMISGSDIDRVVIEDLCLSGSGINGASSIGIRFTLNSNINTSNVILRNLFVNDQAGDGITIATPILTTLQNVKVRYTAGDGFDVANGTSTNFYECFAVTGLGAGFNLDTMTYSSLVGCAAEVYGISYRFNNCSAISVVSCGSEDPIDRSSTNPGYTGISYRNSEVSTTSRVSLISCYSRDPRTPGQNGHISGSFQTFNFRAQSGSQVLTPFKVYGNSEFVGQLSASAYTSSITNGVGFVGTASYALASPGGGSGVTINNNTDNYVVTATGTANTLNGESGLTYNGSLLTINSSVSASSYTSSISNGVGYFGTSSRAVTSSYASSVSGYINFTNGLVVTGTLKVSASSGVSEIRGQELDVFANGRVLGLFALGSSGPYATWFDNTNNNEFDIGRSDSVSGVGRSYDFMTYVDRGFGFYTNNVYTPKMLISASGNVGINVTAPPHKLSLSGSFIIGSGSIGVGASPNATLGRIDASNDIVAFSSDRRLKTNITKITSSLERINQLTGFTYKWNDLANTIAGYDTDSTYVGVYAQEVQAVLPEAVKIAPFDNDGTDKSISGQNYLTVQYEKLVPLLIEAIKELKAEVDELRGKSK